MWTTITAKWGKMRIFVWIWYCVIVVVGIQMNIKYFTFLCFKGSVENRLLTSVFYDFGKLAFEQCPTGYSLDLNDCHTKNYFQSCLNFFAELFPNFDFRNPQSCIADCKIEVGNGTMVLPLAYIRRAARNGFRYAGEKLRRPFRI